MCIRDSCVTDKSKCTGKAPEPPAETPEPEKEKPAGLKDVYKRQIYDRILERCAPILFDGKNFREENAGATRQTAKEIVNSKQD